MSKLKIQLDLMERLEDMRVKLLEMHSEDELRHALADLTAHMGCKGCAGTCENTCRGYCDGPCTIKS
jgi:hypothetical protein